MHDSAWQLKIKTLRVHKTAIRSVVFGMKVFTRSQQSVLNQLSAIRDAIDDEQSYKSPSVQKIETLRTLFAECADELAHIEIRKWRIANP